MIFTRTLVTVRLHQVKAHHSDLAVSSLRMAVNRFMPTNMPQPQAKDSNEIHSPLMIFMTHLTLVTVHEVIDRSLTLCM